VKDGGKIQENQPAPRSTEAAVNPSDRPAEAPSQLNEASSSTSGDAATGAATESSTATTKDDAKNASSSRKAKKKHHFKIPIPF
jgi:hypothetical protein